MPVFTITDEGADAGEVVGTVYGSAEDAKNVCIVYANSLVDKLNELEETEMYAVEPFDDHGKLGVINTDYDGKFFERVIWAQEVKTLTVDNVKQIVEELYS